MKKKKVKKLLKHTCTSCGNCCSDTVVPINHADLGRLVNGTDLKAGSIVKMYSIDEIDWDEDRDGWIHLSKGNRIMGLKKKKERCMFLTEENMCSVYEHRPITCRSFPFDIDVKDGKICSFLLNDKVDCNVKKGGKMNSYSEISEIARKEEDDDSLFYEKIREFNNTCKGDEGKKEFLRFLGF